jgi:Domain of unknown function (DUF6471)
LLVASARLHAIVFQHGSRTEITVVTENRGQTTPQRRSSVRRGASTYAEPAERLKDHGLPGETEASIKAKLRRGTFAATFLLATLAALELEGVRLEAL